MSWQHCFRLKTADELSDSAAYIGHIGYHPFIGKHRWHRWGTQFIFGHGQQSQHRRPNVISTWSQFLDRVVSSLSAIHHRMSQYQFLIFWSQREVQTIKSLSLAANYKQDIYSKFLFWQKEILNRKYFRTTNPTGVKYIPTRLYTEQTIWLHSRTLPSIVLVVSICILIISGTVKPVYNGHP